jgi:hypothetical protein
MIYYDEDDRSFFLSVFSSLPGLFALATTVLASVLKPYSLVAIVWVGARGEEIKSEDNFSS